MLGDVGLPAQDCQHSSKIVRNRSRVDATCEPNINSEIA